MTLLFSSFPQASPATLFGTNKLASVVGTSSAAIQYGRRLEIPCRAAAPAALAAALGSWLDTRAVALFPSAALRHGAVFIPTAFLCVVVVPTLRFSADTFLRQGVCST